MKSLFTLLLIFTISSSFATEAKQAVCFENLYLETGSNGFDSESLTIQLDFEKMTASSKTQGAWGGHDYGTVIFEMTKNAYPIQKTITSVGTDGHPTDNLKLKINGFMRTFTDKSRPNEGAPAEVILKTTNSEGKVEYGVALMNCFAKAEPKIQ
jgi:hypothetical protein